jgi:hypothetical protein
MKITSFALGLMATTAAAAVPTNAAAGVKLAVGVSVGTPIQVADHGYYYGGRDASRYGYERGLREGQNNGYSDGRKGRRFDIRGDGDYRDSDDGYKGWMGPRWEYSRAFRRGFEVGYRQAFDNGVRDRRSNWRHDHDDDRNSDRDHDDRW